MSTKCYHSKDLFFVRMSKFKRKWGWDKQYNFVGEKRLLPHSLEVIRTCGSSPCQLTALANRQTRLYAAASHETQLCAAVSQEMRLK